MSFEFAPLSNFIRYSDRTPMTAKEYQATIRPQSSSMLSADTKIDQPEESIDNSSPKDRMRDYMRNLASQLDTSSSVTLLNSIGSRSFGASGGLYSGVGQMPAAQMQSLIRRYA
ncbi:hypothetical protein MNBD_NITROSPINAE03-186 [hydrothermal vent metagenome]|uniref:Uncharacterized protein n=1 Tax=hydrothermal vent metagenome TaxID=652676 RepID=A0A3B1C2W2_9ZZZZ